MSPCSTWLSDDCIGAILTILQEVKGESLDTFVATNTQFYSLLVPKTKPVSVANFDNIRKWYNFTAKVGKNGGPGRPFTKDLNNLQMCIPIHKPGHWILAWIDFRLKTIEIWDSLQHERKDVLTNLWTFVKKLFTENGQEAPKVPEWKSIDNKTKTPLQPNGFDCGVYVIWFVYCKLFRHGVITQLPKKDKTTGLNMRQLFAKWLCDGKMTNIVV